MIERSIKPNKLDCLKCGVCCYFPYANKKIIAKLIARGIVVGEDGWCIYYDKIKKCTIHNKRPFVCENYIAGSPNCLRMRKERLGITE